MIHEKASVPSILFVCGHNAGRSQIAEAFARAFFDPTIKIASAGTHPAAEINPIVVEAMQEAGINMGGQHPKLLTPTMWKDDTRVIGMG